MILKLLPIIPLFAATLACAQEKTTTLSLDSAPVMAMATPPQTGDLITETFAKPLPFYGGSPDGVERVCFLFNFRVDYNISSGKYGNISTTGKGFGWGYGLGLAIPMRPSNSDANRFITVSVNAVLPHLEDQYAQMAKVDSTIKSNNKYDFGYLSVPVMFNSVKYGRSDVKGFYWRAGVELLYNLGAKWNDRDISKFVNKFAVAPMIGCGFSGIGDVRTRSGNEFPLNFTIGPFASYNAMNILNTGGASLKYFTFGIQLTDIFI